MHLDPLDAQNAQNAVVGRDKLAVPAAGLGAYVSLDYTVGGDARFEHAVVLLASQWEDLYHLIYNPSFFVEAWRQRYGSTPDHSHAGFTTPEWFMLGPITIVIEPLTSYTPKNFVLLKSLETLYPGFGALNIGMAIDAFPSAVINAANAPLSDWSSIRPTKGLPPLTAKPFPLAFIAEFAIATRTLSVYYIPQPPAPERRYQSGITQMTINKVAYTDLHLLHFDLVMPEGAARHQVATSRAEFVMDYLENPAVVGSVEAPGYLHAAAAFLPDEKAQNLMVTPGVATSVPQFRSAGPPSVIIDSVWAGPQSLDPGVEAREKELRYDLLKLRSSKGLPVIDGMSSSPSGAFEGSNSGNSGDGPPVCVVANSTPYYENGQLVGYILGGVLVKVYNYE